ncbi:G patch domain-containing protein 4 [Neopsephotus bourkii]|uniref:G patch domain-containing protein 4 n=1 Tax=Neopsephotus bourkii TaxID=309878 RepID=UPI002AA54C1F|nr:G patch domain-containing protein 4 [Neopsephotus bourkii]
MSAPGSPGRGLGFAERQLRRHGWRRGQGLGRQEHGIAEPIRVKVKCGTAGVGHDASEPFSFHWWDHVFNQAAANIAVEAGQDGISVKALSEQGVRISNRKPHKASGTPSLLYGRFVKSATLTAHGEEPTGSMSSEEEEEEEELDLSSARRLTDEELMRVCGGRTAHKGARHGLTMSAKLARLEEQERAFLATYGHKEPNRRQGKKGKREERRDGASAQVLQRQEPSEEEEGDERKAAKRKKKKHQEPDGEEEVAGEEGKAARRRKKKKKKQEEEEEPIENKEPIVMEKKKRKKQEKENEEERVVMEKKKRKRQENKEEPVVMEKKKQKENKGEPIVMEKKRKKKQKENKEPTVMEKKQQQQHQDREEPAEGLMPLEDTDGPDQARHSPRKKKKRRRRKDPE